MSRFESLRANAAVTGILPDAVVAAASPCSCGRHTTFAYADSFDEVAGRCRGLRCGQLVNVTRDSVTGLLVRPDVRSSSRKRPPIPGGKGGVARGGGTVVTPPEPGGTGATGSTAPARPKRDYGTVVLDSTRVGRYASQVADEVISQLAGLVDASVKVTLEIDARCLTEGQSRSCER
jgi:hypothetical protein